MDELEIRSLATEVKRVHVYEEGSVEPITKDVMRFLFHLDAEGNFRCQGAMDSRYFRLPQQLENEFTLAHPTRSLWCTWMQEGLSCWPTAIALDGELLRLRR